MKKELTHKQNILRMWVFFVFGITLWGCSVEDKLDSTSAALSSSGFNYETKSNVSLKLKVINLYDQPAPGVAIQAYFEYPLESGSSVLKQGLQATQLGQTNVNGELNTVLTIPSYVGKAYILVSNVEFRQVFEVDGSQSSFSKTITLSKMSFRGQPMFRGTSGDTDPVAYTRNSKFLQTDANWTVLGTFDATTGGPNYIESVDVTGFTTLDGYASQIANFNGINSNLTTIENNTQVWVSFYSEGAAYYNTMGYFYYPAGNPPSDSASIKKIVIFPNASASPVANNRSSTQWLGGGALVRGSKVKLKYYDTNTSTWVDRFPAGVTISWFVNANGYGGAWNYGTNATIDNRIFQYGGFLTSVNKLNGPGEFSQVSMYFDMTTHKKLLGFEDTNRRNNVNYLSDNDFNDVMFVVETNPIIEPNIILTSTGTLAYEDNWPSTGDYDFNDLVVDYKTQVYLNTQEQTVDKIVYKVLVKAVGAIYRNGFAVEIPGNPSNVNVQTSYSGSATLLANAIFPRAASGVETGTGSSNFVVPFFDNAFTLFGSSFIPGYPNTDQSDARAFAADTITKTITFTTPVSMSALGTAPFNPFIIVNGERGKEVHLASKHGTAKATISYYGTQNDLTNQSTLWYVGTSSKPWALDLTDGFKYPTVANSIEQAYPYFSTWASSAGVNKKDWYKNTGTGYRDNSKIYSK